MNAGLFEKSLTSALNKCVLFQSLSEAEIRKNIDFNKLDIRHFYKNDSIALEDDECTALGVVIEGTVDIQKLNVSGKIFNINHLTVGEIFGEAVVFSDSSKYPANIISTANSKILFLHANDIICLCSSNRAVLQNFMAILSNRILMLNEKIKMLSSDSLRNKVCCFLINEYKKQQSLRLSVSASRKSMAEDFGVTRPSLSREMINMREEGIIEFNKDFILIKDITTIKEFA